MKSVWTGMSESRLSAEDGEGKDGFETIECG